MPPKRSAVSNSSSTSSTPTPKSQHQQPQQPHTSSSTSSTGTPTPKPASASSKSSSSSAAALTSNDPREIAAQFWNTYTGKTPQRVKLIDAFMGFLVLVGGLQFAYCVVVGNYPFNAFLSGFGATVGQFVLTASLRIQTNPANQAEFASVSHERAFADFVLGSLILHFFCVNFIN